MPPFIAKAGQLLIDPERVTHTLAVCTVPGCDWPGVSLGSRDSAETVFVLHLIRAHAELACQLLDDDVEFDLPATRQPSVVERWS